MVNLNNILLSDFSQLIVRCDQGIDHGKGYMVWMHPPVHRVLGWVTSTSSLNLHKEVWRLDQLKKISNEFIYVKGLPSVSDQPTLDRIPSLINTTLLNKNGLKIATLVDLVFNYNSGRILYYLVSRSNPRIPGSSRWSLKIDHIKDQQPGMILSNLNSLDDLPLLRASVKEEILKKSKGWRNQIQDITNVATNKLEGWLEESPWEDRTIGFSNTKDSFDNVRSNYENKELQYDLDPTESYNKSNNNDSDPWI
ncbi:PRC-barrel domain containing protein [Prochlorococcus sp. MIT 1223]|uniref:PRC-barrel domain containing protein n=1 Tax=Prochlorococcus sp. MIT 1223 TaxID=3096217 RepID=UPI002A7555A4|nr:PRC-barrel domain containing protein [Prochlorococcus sp. MIT 1223]